MKKLLKKAGWWVIGILALLLGISFLLPSNYVVERSKTIDAPLRTLYSEVVDLREWKDWAPWPYFEPGVELSYSNPPAGEGAYCHWESNAKKVGKGRVVLAEVREYERIVAVFSREDKQFRSLEFSFKEVDDETTVVIRTDGQVGWNPVRKYGLLFKKASVSREFKRGLNALSTLAFEAN